MTATEFVRFLEQATRGSPRKEVHLILDNVTAHKTAAVQGWVAKHPHVHLHYTPTYSSWLNQVGLWVGKNERDCNESGVLHLHTRSQKETAGLH